ncbi:pilus assembly protein [Shewanella sp. UCD-KL21]|uniref:pilus assembly protein n=1 Tax=Shewanella sp. UCD-KL21 TaxID=1917164 RepID=UPI000970CA4C|nr:PilC/PilY family type IV pilus protein [Shewanella sp. UCD-KL21]
MFNKLLCSTTMALIFMSAMSFADDTELYLIDSSVSSGKRPQVLFIFDNSGSMSTEDQNVVSPYCGDACEYPEAFDDYLAGYSGYINDKGIYWNAGGIDNSSSRPTPDSPNDSRRFYADNNNCNTSVSVLAEKGRFTGFLREFKSSGNTGEWTLLAENNGFNQNQVVECYEDIYLKDPNNPGFDKGKDFDPGYPIDTKEQYTDDSDEDARQESLDGSAFGTGTPVTLYTAHYLVWYKWVTTTEEGQNSGGTGTRLESAKSALSFALDELKLITPIDAGLAIFNLNYPSEGNADGGRIVYGLNEMNDVNQSAFISLTNSLSAQTNTPLCETLYESYLYLSGGPVTFGNDDNNGKGNQKIDDYEPNTPPSIISSGNYTSPFKKCSDTAYIIYITDGAPTLDHNADDAIKSLTDSAVEAGDYGEFKFTNANGDDETSYMPALASYMYNNDLVTGVTDSTGIDNKQNVRLYTIGFSAGATAAAALLEEAAHRGGNPRVEGETSSGYIQADTGLDLAEALTGALKSILAVDSSFTSPSIASNNFDKTQTYNSAYFAMFLPGKGPRWSGNLKKLKVNSSGEIVAPGGTAKAIDVNGNIASSTCTYWNTCSGGNVDGNKVNAGGVLPVLRDKLTERKIYTNSGTALIDIDDSSFVANHSQDTLNWLYGVDVDNDNNDDSNNDAREDIMGDPLHSKPLAINYGADADNLDVRILVGTNQGLVHMFKDSDEGSDDYDIGSVSETWAFMPQELWSNVQTLRENPQTGTHSVYGMDLSPVAYTETDDNGKVSKAWAYLGMRRGGSSYYALDITNPNAPSFKWVINSDTEEFEDLGQSWSEPVITSIPGEPGPVLILGGGMASSEGTGAGVYFVNADTGEYIHHFTDSGMSSVPNKVAILDSDNDGITDRVYATDISGNVWRMDLAGNSTSDWSIFKFASISTDSAPDNRMFFVEPTVAQTQFNNIHSESGVKSYQTIPYDAVTVGTGNRTKPTSSTTNDMFFVFQDRNINTKQFTSSDKPAALTISDLYNVTDAAPTNEADNISFGAKRGWLYNLGMDGEKSLSSSLIFDGKVYFTSFVPPAGQSVDLDAGVCGVSGQGRLYVFDLHKGTRSYSELYFELGERVPDTPQIVIPKPAEGEEPIAYIIGVGKGECVGADCKGTLALGSGLTTNRIYYHLNENN